MADRPTTDLLLTTIANNAKTCRDNDDAYDLEETEMEGDLGFEDECDEGYDSNNDNDQHENRNPESFSARLERSRGACGPSIDDRFKKMEQQDDERTDLLLKLDSLRSKGFKVTPTIGFDTPISHLKFELAKHQADYDRKYGVRFGQRFLLAFVSGVEFMNKKFDPFDVDLDGWSNMIHDRIDDYDNVLERLILKYKNRVAVAPEIELVMMLAGSAVTFHMSRLIAKKVEAAFSMPFAAPAATPAATSAATSAAAPAATSAAAHAPTARPIPVAQAAVQSTSPTFPAFDLASIASRLAPIMATVTRQSSPHTQTDSRRVDIDPTTTLTELEGPSSELESPQRPRQHAPVKSAVGTVLELDSEDDDLEHATSRSRQGSANGSKSKSTVSSGSASIIV
jgi:Family of unknown function (DUF5767)